MAKLLLGDCLDKLKELPDNRDFIGIELDPGYIKRLEYVKPDMYRWKKPNGKYYYYEIRTCVACGEKFLTFKYGKVEFCSQKCKGNGRGRPIGYKVGKGLKGQISKSRMGQRQPIISKIKISQALTGYKYNFSEEGKKKWREANVLYNTGKEHPRHRDFKKENTIVSIF